MADSLYYVNIVDVSRHFGGWTQWRSDLRTAYVHRKRWHYPEGDQCVGDDVAWAAHTDGYRVSHSDIWRIGHMNDAWHERVRARHFMQAHVKRALAGQPPGQYVQAYRRMMGIR